MNHDKKSIKLKKSINNSGIEKTDFIEKKEKIISILINKYDLTPNEAEFIFKKLIKKRFDNNSQNKINNSRNNNNQIKQINKQNTLPLKNEKTMKYENHISEKNNEKNTTSNEKLQNQIEDIKNENINKKNISKNNVDLILDDLIPNYNQQVSIELNHINLTFEIQKEKINTLKENFINQVKNKKNEKLKIHALKDISFKIYKGEKVGIIGYNGAGKSTLLKVITGIYHPDNGNIKTYGKISPLLSLGAGFDPNYSGRQNIFLNGAVLGYDKKYLESKLNEIIHFSELEKVIDIPIKNYSSGMIAKLGFSIATIVNPDILIIDEILAVGDVNFSKKSADKIRSLMDSGTTVLLVSHSIPQIRELCDKAIWIDNGLIKEIGEVNRVCDMYLKDAEKASNEQLANINLN